MSTIFTNCLICQSEELKDIKNYEKFFLVSCSNCGFVFSKKIPTQQELSECYLAYTREDYISPITVKRYQDLLDTFEPYRKTSNIIDVGAGNGFFLLEAKKRGWNVYGTEFEQRAVDYCTQKGINMKLGKLDPANYPEEHFDIITSFEVIEHINNPLEEINHFKKILRKGGAVYVTTPNFYSISKNYLGNNWSILHYPEHLSYYTPKTLTLLFKTVGFQKKWSNVSNIHLSRIQQGLKGNGGYSNISDEQMRQKMENRLFWNTAKKIMNFILNLTQKGDSLKALYIK